VLVLNKIDALDDPLRLPLLRQKAEDCVCISAVTGEGLQGLAGRIEQFLDAHQVELTVESGVGNGKLFSLLHARGKVLEETYTNGKARFRVKMPPGLTGVIESLGGRTLAPASGA
jgi:GTP-binding protein HflX